MYQCSQKSFILSPNRSFSTLICSNISNGSNIPKRPVGRFLFAKSHGSSYSLLFKPPESDRYIFLFSKEETTVILILGQIFFFLSVSETWSKQSKINVWNFMRITLFSLSDGNRNSIYYFIDFRFNLIHFLKSFKTSSCSATYIKLYLIFNLSNLKML